MLFGSYHLLLVNGAPDLSHRTFDIWEFGDLVDPIEEQQEQEYQQEIVTPKRNERGLWVKFCSIFLLLQ